MPDFSKGSTFNKDANFQGVKFGADAPLLETELNELQDIQTEARADIIRDTIPSGFVQLGELDYDYMLNNENCVKLKTDSIAYVNGYKVVIPKDTIINIGKAPEKDSREDLVFLEVWKEEVNKDSILTKNGGEGQAQITNSLLDDRVGQETSRRVALKWRIRHVADVDFNTFTNDGFDKGQSPGVYSHVNAKIRPQGGLKEPIRLTTPGVVLWNDSFFNNLARANLKVVGDKGVFISGNGSVDKDKNGTLDGYVYAIPMFRLYRKPSCGKAIPFEYQKIHPKTDYTKFTTLMLEDKVERVVKENITGKSLFNNFGVVGAWSINRFPFTFVKTNQYCLGTYTIINFSPRSIFYEANKFDGSNYVYKESLYLRPNCRVVVNYSVEANYYLRQGVGLSDDGWTEANRNELKVMMLEGDWTNKPLPKYFTGLKSLSEDEGNLVEVKTGILNESSYDPSTGTPKLNTVSGTNYVTSDNLIIPNIEAQVKRGETKLSDLTSFAKIDNLVGDEKVDFTRIKGRTLQNLCVGVKSKGNDTITVSPNDITFTNTTVAVPVNFYVRLKPNTTYTLIFRILSKTMNQPLDVDLFPDTFQELGGFNSLGVNRKVFTTESDLSTLDCLRYYVRSAETGTIKVSYPMILEGDFSTTPIEQLPYINNIKSVADDENNKIILKRSGKNIIGKFDVKLKSGIDGNTGVVSSYPTRAVIVVPTLLDTSKTYTLSITNSTTNMVIREISKYDKFENFKGTTGSLTKSITFTGAEIIKFTLLYPGDAGTITSDDISNLNIQLEEGSLTTYEPYKEYKQEITLKEPLRSLPNGVCDTIEGNKVIRRIGKLVLNGTENWTLTSNQDTNCIMFNLVSNPSVKTGSRLLCDKFLYSQSGDYERVNCTGNIFVNITKTRLVSQDVQGFKTWLSQNPTTIYYELANPIEEPIEPNYDKESIKTYQLDAPLRSLPNGVKDEIIGNKLIRRCGEVYVHNLITSSNMAVPSTQTDLDRLFCYIGFTQCKKSSKINIISDRLPNKSYPVTSDFDADTTTVEYISNYNGADVSNWLYIKVLKTKLESLNRAGFEKWLIENPIKLIYELTTPIEIPLNEVHSNTANFTLQRQFSSGNYLRELPNGVKDTVENGKVTRRVKKVVLNGSENFIDSGFNLTNTMTFQVSSLGKSNSLNILCNNLTVFGAEIPLNTTDLEGVWADGGNDIIYIKINKSRLSQQDVTGFKTWLSSNPISIIFPLKTPTTEELSGNNNRYCPYHIEDNTYCGSLYVGNGTNDVLVNNGLNTDSVVIDTNFRSIENKKVVTDCKYKKNVDGYDTMYQNLFNGSYVRGNFDSNTGQEITHATNNRSDYIKVSPKTNYTIIHKLTKLGVRVVCYTNDKQIICVINNALGDFTTPDNCAFIRFTCDGVNIDWSQILLTLGSNILPFKNFNTGMSCFENTEANDVDDLRHLVSLTGFNYEQILNESFDLLLRGML